MALKILAISDTHGALPTPPDKEYDLFVHCGDICPHSKQFRDSPLLEGSWQKDWFETNFLPWCKKIKANMKIILGGNHDNFSYSDDIGPDAAGLFEALYFYRIGEVEGIKNLTIKGHKIHIENRTYFDCDRRQIFKLGQYNSIFKPFDDLSYNDFSYPNDADIIISHQPPYNLLDNGYGNPVFKHYLDMYGPKLVICGHIHECYGHIKYDRFNAVTNIYNTAGHFTEITI